MVVTELTEQSFQQQLTEDEELNQLVKKRVELCGQVEQFAAIIDAKTQALLAEYSEVIGKISDRKSRYMYLQSTKNCVRLIKALKII